MRVHICGSRGSASAPGQDFVRYGGHTSCVAICPDGRTPTLILDAGSGIRNVGRLLGEAAFAGSIVLGHLHWDHTCGLPFFSAGDQPESRVDLFMPHQEGEEAVSVLERSMSPPHFPITPAQLRGRWSFNTLKEGTHLIEEFEVTAREIPHKGGTTFGYRVEDGRASVAYLSDHNPTAVGDGPTGFGAYHEAAVELAEGVDLLIHDAQYSEGEWESRSDYGHSTPTYAIGLAQEAGAGSVLLFHHDIDRTDAQLDALADACRQVPSVDVRVAFEGQVIDVPGNTG